MNNRLPSGQVGLLLLVIMGVVVALIMSVASRSLSDTVLSRQEKESSAAFAVAETGIENALNSLRQGTIPPGIATISDALGLVSGQYAVSEENSYSLYAREGETAHLDLSGFVGPSINILWTKKLDDSENLSCSDEGSELAPAALEITEVDETSETTSVSYYNASNCDLPGNGFLLSSSGGDEYLSAITFSPAPGTTILRLKPIYAGATIGVNSPGLVTQLYLIQSSASGGEAQKEIEVKRGLDAPPSIFDYAVFSGGTIVK